MTTLRRYVRQVVAPNGKHRPKPRTVGSNDLLGPDRPSPPTGGVLVQAWDDCTPCGKATAGVLHKDGWTCGECLTSAGPDTTTNTIGGTS